MALQKADKKNCKRG